MKYIHLPLVLICLFDTTTYGMDTESKNTVVPLGQGKYCSVDNNSTQPQSLSISSPLPHSIAVLFVHNPESPKTSAILTHFQHHHCGDLTRHLSTFISLLKGNIHPTLPRLEFHNDYLFFLFPLTQKKLTTVECRPIHASVAKIENDFVEIITSICKETLHKSPVKIIKHYASNDDERNSNKFCKLTIANKGFPRLEGPWDQDKLPNIFKNQATLNFIY